MAEVIPTVPDPVPAPKEKTDVTEDMKKSLGASRTLMEYVLSFAQKRLALVCFGVWKFCEIQLYSQESDAKYAAEMAGHWKDLIVVFVLSETAIKVASLFSLAISGKKEPVDAE